MIWLLATGLLVGLFRHQLPAAVFFFASLAHHLATLWIPAESYYLYYFSAGFVDTLVVLAISELTPATRLGLKVQAVAVLSLLLNIAQCFAWATYAPSEALLTFDRMFVVMYAITLLITLVEGGRGGYLGGHRLDKHGGRVLPVARFRRSRHP